MTIKAEPRIYTKKPKWHNLKELGRNSSSVIFDTGRGQLIVPVKYVEEWESRQ